jgi:hypothetical protein
MRVLVISHKHGLLPLAWRLVRDGHDVSVAVCTERYSKAWAGKFTPIWTGRKPKNQQVHAVREIVQETGAAVYTDSFTWRDALEDLPNLYPTLPSKGDIGPLQLSAWFDGTGFSQAHLVVEDRGAWTGGQGPSVVSAVTMLRWPRNADDIFNPLSPALVAENFRGQVRVGISIGPDGAIVPAGMRAGWSVPHYHVPLGTGKVATAVTVSISPWPTECNVAPERVRFAPSKALMAATAFHDIQVEDEGVVTAGTDGLVGVVTGSGHSWDMLRARVASLAAELASLVPGAQYRLDFGQSIPMVVGAFENVGVYL